jgi:hypothetical protein
MTPDERSLLERTYKLVEENNDILRSMRRANRLSMFFRFGYWAIIIITSIGAYYAIQPYLTLLMNSINGVTTDIHTATSAAQSLKDLLGN